MGSIGSGSLFVSLMLLLAATAGCVSTGGTHGGGPDPTRLGHMFFPDLSARSPRRDGGAWLHGAAAGAELRSEIIGGGDGPPYGLSTGSLPGQEGSVQLNFQGADLSEVVDAILGAALGLSYTIDPDVSGEVTLATAGPVGRDDLLDLLEVVLNVNGAEITRSGDVYKVVEATDATVSRVDFAGAGPGYGLSIIPLRYISPQTLSRLVNGFGVRPGSLRIEETRNLLIVLGGSAERRSAIETAAAFDVDWMRNQSVGILPVRNAKPEAVIPELERIFASSGDGAVVQFMPIARLKAILAISQNRTLVERAQDWVQRLDRENPAADERVHVYRVKYREADVLADLLAQLFSPGGGTVGSALDASDGVEPESPALFEASLPAGEEDQAELEAVAVGTRPATPPPGAPHIRADASNNSIVIYGDLDARRRVLDALARIDVPQLQVAINVTMVEVSLTDQLAYGVQYFVKSNSVGLGRDNGSAGLFNTLANNIARELPGFNFVLGSEASPDIIINALDEITDLQVLSSPSLVVMENEEARFQVGDQIPIVTRTVTSVEDANAPISNQVEYRDTGIIMRVRPRISDNGVVTMKIDQEISSASANSGTLTPIISNRSITSSVSVVDGQTVLLGGLIRDQEQAGKSGIPGLRRLGPLFGSRTRSNQRTELLILIRPTVIRDSKDAQAVAEDLRAEMWHLRAPPIK